MVVQRAGHRNLSVRQVLLACVCVLASIMTTGCKDRSPEVVGIWVWGTYNVHFDADGSWGAADKRNPGFEKMGGTWNLNGDTLSISASSGTAPDASFILAEDGRSLEADTAAVGTMTKQQISAVASVP